MKSIPELKCLFLEISRDCPLNCRMCLIGHYKDKRKSKLTEDEYINIITRFSNMRHDEFPGLVAFCGGEVLKEYDLVINLSKKCRELGLICALTTNGYYIKSHHYEELLTNGPTNIQFSIDSLDPEIHDNIRKFKGHWEMQINHLKNILKKKRELEVKHGKKVDCLIGPSIIIAKWNYDKIMEMFSFFMEELGCENISFQPLMIQVDTVSEMNDFYSENLEIDMKILKINVEELRNSKYFNKYPTVDENSLNYLLKYFSENRRNDSTVCDSFDRNMIIDLEGNLALCFPFQRRMGKFLGVYPAQKISELWYSEEVQKIRKILENCNWDCGYMSCHRKLFIKEGKQ